MLIYKILNLVPGCRLTLYVSIQFMVMPLGTKALASGVDTIAIQILVLTNV